MPLWARLRRGGENDGAGRRSHGREADGRPGSAQRNATDGSKGRSGNGSRVWEKRKAPRCRGDDYESPTAYFLSIKKVGKER